MRRAMRSFCPIMISKALRRISARSRGARAAQAGSAAAAASTAETASATVPSATDVSTCSVAGSTTSNRRRSLDSRHTPPMNRFVGRFRTSWGSSCAAMGPPGESFCGAGMIGYRSLSDKTRGHGMGATGADPGSSALRKVLQRLLPFTMLLFFFSLIDRTNISFAALQMNEDLGFSPTVYGFAAGIFFVGYCLFEVPSNLVLMRVGARRWLARIMLTWGVIVVATAWVSGFRSFYVMRFLLGVAEAGLLPGLFYYLGAWIPASHRGLGLSVLMSTA